MATQNESSGKQPTSPANKQASSDPKIDQELIELIRSSGILNSSATLDNIMNLSHQMAARSKKAARKHEDMLIHEHYVFKHTSDD